MPKYKVVLNFSMDLEADSWDDAYQKSFKVFEGVKFNVPGYSSDNAPIVVSGPVEQYEIKNRRLYDKRGNPVAGTPTVPSED